MKRTVCDNLDTLSSAVAHRIAELAAEAIAERGEFRIALAGGETPRRCYEYLRELPLEWGRVQVFFGDERCLPADDPQRNDRMARASLLDHVPIPHVNIHPMRAELGPEAAAADYAADLASTLGDQPLDLVLLGMGEDGHTASLFPDNPALASRDAVVAVHDAPKPPSDRVSLGMETLNAARHKFFLIAGSGKCRALDRIENGELLPAARIVDAKWFVDREACPIT